MRPFSLRDGYVHGDSVKARIAKRSDGDKLSEVEVISLLHRSEEVLLATIVLLRGKKYLEVRREQGSFRIALPSDVKHYQIGDIIACKFLRDGVFKPLHRFARDGEYDIEERLILFLSGAHTEFSQTVIAESEALTSPKIGENPWELPDRLSPLHEGETLPVTKISPEQPLFFSRGNRIDFRNWYTLTIDGADAKDLDDAISIAPFQNGDTLLGVHIADVAEYVREHTWLEKEALARATSIYTPGRVIPMLPERLSDDLCSLHPGSPKLVLSCLMLVDARGKVKHTEIVEGIIESQRKGVYEDIYSEYHALKDPVWAGEVGISLAFSLYEILKKRRQKEGKIIFESTELKFSGDTRTGIEVEKRDRNDAHMMIEEFMVLANEEVAKWCVRHELPFLSRVHGLPSTDNLEFIAEIIGNREVRRKLEPHHIREYMEKVSDPLEQFRLSRLLLPKMAKATYADKPFRHFGLALSFYSHFTSPIRRYPDLQVHRIIKEKLHEELTSERKAHYRGILKRIAKHTSERERGAEDIERAFDALYACRYMQDKVGQTFQGRISGITEYALYIELESGIEGTCYLPRKKYHVNPLTGSLETLSGKELYRIGQEANVTVNEVNMNEKRILLVPKER